MLPAGNVGSEMAETSKKRRTRKVTTATEGASKGAKAADVLAQRKAYTAKTTLPPVDEKTAKLTKISENLIRRQTEAAKVVAAEREKKAQDIAPLVALEKKLSQRERTPAEVRKIRKSLARLLNRQRRSLKRKNKKWRRFPRLRKMLMPV
jgi:hypothetical protein